MFGCGKCERQGDDGPVFDIAFQPVFDVRSNKVRAYEALVRGPNGEAAATVLSRVDQHNRHRFDQRIRVTAIEKAAALGLVQTSAALSINIMPSAVIEATRCLRHTLEAAARVGLANRRIVFEFTEDVRLDLDHARALVDTYRAYGFRCALDDFGAGYAGLLTLASVPTDFVKLDMGLIRDIDSCSDRRRIVGGMVGILKELGREVVAEGVETAGELATVTALGIPMVQGFYLGRPSLSRLQAKPRQLAHAA